MPNRVIREGILTSDRVDKLDASSEVFYRRLLNRVDDHGLFDGRVSIIRAALYPLRSDRLRESDVSRWLAACEKAGLIVLYEADGKPYLKILDTRWQARSEPKFPIPTNEQMHAAENNCQQLRPYSLSETKTKTGDQQRRNDASMPQIPALLSQSEPFVSAWTEWIEHRREIKHPLTPRAARSHLASCEEWGPERSIAAIRFSVGGGYQALVEPKGSAKPKASESDDNGFVRAATTPDIIAIVEGRQPK